MHIFNDINVNGRQTREREHCDIPKKIKLAFEISCPVNETQFSKITIAKNDNFFTNVNLSVSKY